MVPETINIYCLGYTFYHKERGTTTVSARYVTQEARDQALLVIERMNGKKPGTFYDIRISSLEVINK